MIEENGVDLEALKRLDLYEWWRNKAAIIAALERAEIRREAEREKTELIKMYAGPTGMTPEDVAYALERAALYRSALLYIKTGDQTAKKMREIAAEALATAPAEEERCRGCDERGVDVRQQPNGDLVCGRCGRLISSAEEKR